MTMFTAWEMGKQPLRDELIFFGSRFAALEVAREVHGHRLVKESGAGVEEEEQASSG